MLNKITLILSAGGILTSFYLVMSDFLQPGFCPKLLSVIPACYVALIAFILVLASCFFTNKTWGSLSFYSGSLTGLLLAAWFSYNQLAGLEECPKILNFPLCYASFFTFLIIIILKFLSYIKIRKHYKFCYYCNRKKIFLK